MILEKSAQSLLGICFWREAPEAVVGPDRRAGKRGCSGCSGGSAGGASLDGALARKPPELAEIW